MTMINPNQSNEPQTPKMGKVESFLRHHDLTLTGFSFQTTVIYWVCLAIFLTIVGVIYVPKLNQKILGNRDEKPATVRVDAIHSDR